MFLNSVLPLETISQMASAKPILGAISTDPLIICNPALILFLDKNDFTVFEELQELLAEPYSKNTKLDHYQKAPTLEEIVPNTFCGT